MKLWEAKTNRKIFRDETQLATQSCQTLWALQKWRGVTKVETGWPQACSLGFTEMLSLHRSPTSAAMEL